MNTIVLSGYTHVQRANRTLLMTQLSVMGLIVVVLLSPFAAAAAPFAPGVKSGQWAGYTESLAVSNRSLLGDIPGASMLGFPDSTTINSSLNITSASPDSSNVTFSTTAHYLNSSIANPSSPSAQTWIDLSIGWGGNEPPFIIAGNLYGGAEVGLNTPLILNKTESLSFNLIVPGSSYTVKVSRNVNELRYNSTTIYPTGNATSFVRYFWDQVTGAPMNIFVHGTVYKSGSTASFNYGLSMTTTNMWAYAPPPAPPGLTVNPQPSAGSGVLFGLQFGELYILIGAAVAVAVGVVGVTLRRSSGDKDRRVIASRQKKSTRGIAREKDTRSKKK